jgi:hypothetical protein
MLYMFVSNWRMNSGSILKIDTLRKLGRYSAGIGGRSLIPGRGKRFLSSTQRPELHAPIQLDTTEVKAARA